jgi:hypothetical protein
MKIFRTLIAFCAVGALVLFFAVQTFAATGILKQINFQGKVVNKTVGTNVTDGSYNFTFGIYSVDTGGAAIWTETKSVTVTNGIFQTLLGDTTPLPGSIDFNTDNLYLGINFNSDGEMTPRIRLAAVPYAFNAEKVAGLTVTNTTGTLTIPNGRTIQFGDAFTTSGANALTLTTTGSTNVTLPTSGILVSEDSTNILTNKTIGSTGLTFSGSSTDITTAAGEALTLVGNAASSLSTTAGAITLQAAGSGTISTIQIGAGGSGSTTNDFLALDVYNGTTGTDPSGGAEGYMYYHTTDNVFRCYVNSAWVNCNLPSADSVDFSELKDTMALDANLTINQGAFTWVQNYTGTSGAGFTQNSTGAITSGNAAFDVAVTNANTTIPGLMVSYAGSDAALRINDDGTSSDSTPVIVNALGNLGIGTVSADELLTVGGVSNRGNIALYGDLFKEGLRKQIALANIVSITIYDTSRDVDGGAWTKNVGVSWYNETKDDGPGDVCDISTDDRCGSSVFPDKAIIVSTPDSVYIFDAATNSMWMKFTQGGTFSLGANTNNNPSGVFGLNGVVYVGTNGAASTGMYAFDFVNDRMFRYNTTNRSQGDKDIGNRNTTVAYATNSITQLALIDNAVNDVHGAVISGSSTVVANSGPLQGITLVAVATDTGISVVNLSASLTVDYSDVTGDDYNAVFLTKRARLYALNETQAQGERWNAVDVDTVDKTNNTPDIYDETAVNRANIAKTAPTILVAPDALEVVERASYADELGDIVYIGTSLGLTEIHTVDSPSATSLGWSKFYDTTRTTGFMSGNNRGYFLFNEASGNLADSSINTGVFTSKGTPTYGVTGVNGTALTFNGTSQYLCSDANNDNTCDNNASYATTTISFNAEIWFKHNTAITNEDVLLSYQHSTNGTARAGWVVWMNSSGQMRFGIDDDATWTLSTASIDDVTTVTGAGAKSYADNQWHHLVAVNTDTAIHLYVDGVLLGSDTALASTATLDQAQVLMVGATCASNNCATGANFWDGSVDDMALSMGGSTTSETLTQTAIRKRFLAGREMLNAKSISVTNATSATTSTITDSAETWTPNEFVGKVVDINGGTGAGQSRKVTANTATTLTVSPDWTITPDTTTDFRINPEVLYGASNNVYAIAAEDTIDFGNLRKVYVGTNSSTDTGGVSVLRGMGNLVFDVYHSDAGLTDDFGSDWSGTDADDIVAIGAKTGTVVIGSLANVYDEIGSWNLQSKLDDISNSLQDTRQELISSGLAGTSFEAGQLGGADLAENFASEVTLETGTLVALKKDKPEWIEPTSQSYQASTIGVVATKPGIILGTKGDNIFPIALAGRVPVLVTDQNELVQAGDFIGSSDTLGFGMRVSSGRVVGVALEGSNEMNAITCPDGVVDRQCHRVVMLVNSTFLGQNGFAVTDSNSTSNDSSVLGDSIDSKVDSRDIMQFITQADNETVLTVNRGLFDNLTVSNEAFIKLLIVEQELRLGDTLIDKFGIRTQKLRVSDTAGRDEIKKGSGEIWVPVTQLTQSDLVLVLPVDPKHQLQVGKKLDGIGFSVTSHSNATEAIPFQWWVVGTQ